MARRLASRPVNRVLPSGRHSTMPASASLATAAASRAGVRRVTCFSASTGTGAATASSARSTRSISSASSRATPLRNPSRPNSAGQTYSTARAGFPSRAARPISCQYASSEALGCAWRTNRTFGLSTPMPNAIVATTTSSRSMKASCTASRCRFVRPAW